MKRPLRAAVWRHISLLISLGNIAILGIVTALHLRVNGTATWTTFLLAILCIPFVRVILDSLWGLLADRWVQRHQREWARLQARITRAYVLATGNHALIATSDSFEANFALHQLRHKPEGRPATATSAVVEILGRAEGRALEDKVLRAVFHQEGCGWYTRIAATKAARQEGWLSWHTAGLLAPTAHEMLAWQHHWAFAQKRPTWRLWARAHTRA